MIIIIIIISWKIYCTVYKVATSKETYEETIITNKQANIKTSKQQTNEQTN